MQMEENKPGISLQEVLKNARIKVGDRIRVRTVTDGGRITGHVNATVVAVYARHVLLDMGKYKENHSIVDIYFNPKGIYERL